MKTKTGISLGLIAILLFGSFSIAYAEVGIVPEVAGVEDVDAVVEAILEEGDFTVAQEVEIADDVELLADANVPIDEIESVEEIDGEMVYTIEYGNGYVDEISIDEETSGEIYMTVTEGDLVNEVIIRDDGTMVIDGIECDFTDSVEPEVVVSGYGPWQTTCPKTVSKWGSAFSVSSSKNITLPKAAGALTVGALTTFLGGVPAVAAVGYISSVSTFASKLKGYDPKATAVSMKVTGYNSVTPAGIQKRVSYWYAKPSYNTLIYNPTAYAFRWV